MNWDYIAGFLDGDGSFFLSNHTNKKQRIFRFSLANDNIGCLLEIQNFLTAHKLKSIIQPYTKANKRHFMLRVNKQHDLLILANQLQGKVIIKRKSILDAIETIPKMNLRHPIHEDEILSKQCLSLWQSGLGSVRIAKLLNVTHNQVHWYIHNKLGIRRPRVRRVK